MRLKSLEMQGFKSFPDKTVISFGEGMTAIVGPNGSGKSNISDAVRFVLGEVSSKTMRGDKMEDVIFGGTDRRRPMSFAEVSITFDNRWDHQVNGDAAYNRGGHAPGDGFENRGDHLANGDAAYNRGGHAHGSGDTDDRGDNLSGGDVSDNRGDPALGDGDTDERENRLSGGDAVVDRGGSVSDGVDYADAGMSDTDFAEGSGRLALDYDEVTVTRRLSRGGNSDYFINRRPVRLRDVAELFMNTGLGKAGYSLIGQGRVAEIISQNSGERRGIFEEAAGIAKYRYKKEEAERKLAEADENLARATDLTAELSARLGPLKAEAEKAQTYLSVFADKKQADVSLTLYDLERLRAGQTGLDEKYNAAKSELDAADGEIKSLENESDRLQLASQDAKIRSEKLLREQHACDEERHRLETARGVAENEIKHQNEQISSLTSENALRAASLEAARAKSKGLEEKLKALEERAAQDKSVWESLDAEVAELQARLKENAAARQTLSQRLSEAQKTSVDARLRLSGMEGAGASDAARRAEIEKQLEEARASRGVLAGRLEKTEENIASYAEKLNEASEKLRASDEARAAQISQRDSAEDEFNRLRAELSSKNQRIDALRRMDELLEGYASSVRHVMEAAGGGKLNGVCGPVSKLIAVRPKYSVAVETALGANIQNIVVEDETAAKAAIALLKADGAGRATFYPLTTLHAAPLTVSPDDLARYRGYVGIASSIVDYDKRYSPAIDYLLGRTAVFDDLEDASEAARAFGYRVRMVTLDGQLINAGGSFTGGSVRRDSGMLTRSSEISRLEAELARQKIDLRARQTRLNELAAAIAAAVDEREDQAGTQKMLEALDSAEKTQREVLRSRESGEETRIKGLEDERAAIDAKTSQGQAGRKALKDAADKADAEAKSACAELEALTSQAAELDAEYKTASQAASDARVALTAQEKDRDSAGAALSFNAASVKALTDGIAHGEAEINVCHQKSLEYANAAEEARAGAESQASQAENCATARLAADKEAQDADKRLTELTSSLRERTRGRELLFREYTRLESQRTAQMGEVDKLVTRLWDDYELTCASAQQLGYPELTEQTRPLAAARSNECRAKLRELGTVNVGAIDEYREVETRWKFLSGQCDDLRKAKTNLAAVISRLEREMRARFSAVFDDINANFKTVFAELFGGGTANLSLSDPSDVLSSGIEIEAAPPGKVIKNLSLLSGGEQAFIAIALFFAILKVNPAPFCILDEIEAALDDVNVVKFAEYCRRCSDRTQFIAITHRRGTMEAADLLYGITMYEKGVSSVLTLDVNEVEAKTGVRLK